MNTKLIEELSVEDFVIQISRKNKLHQAIALQAVEDYYSDELDDWKRNHPSSSFSEIEQFKELNKTKFKRVRKIFLDWSNEYTRSVLKTIFGNDFEGNLK